MTDREQTIVNAIKGIIRSGVSTDTEPDQDYVCELIDESVKEIIKVDVR